MTIRKIAGLALVSLIPALAACGGGSSTRPDESATLLLDFQPNAVHTGIYTALDRDFTGAEGVHLTVRAPGQSTDPTRLLLTDRVKFAVLDIHDLALARAKGRDLVGVMAIVEDPLAAVIAQPNIATPKDLQGKRVGVTGLPSDIAVLDSIVRGAGGDPAKVRRTTIGFDAVPAILGGKVAGATAFWNAEGVALQAKRPKIHAFRVEDYGAPAYPELVLTVTRTTLQDDPNLVEATVTALQRGYRATISDPESAVQALVKANPGLDAKLATTQLAAVQSAFLAPSGAIGTLDTRSLARWAQWEQRFGIVRERPNVALMFAPRFAQQGAARAAMNDG